MFICISLKNPERTIENQDGQTGKPEIKLACPTMVLSAFGPRAGHSSIPACIQTRPTVHTSVSCHCASYQHLHTWKLKYIRHF